MTKNPAGARDAAVITLAWATGVRQSELAELQRSDFVKTGDDEGDLRIHGKGDKTRTVYIYNGAAAALPDWRKREMALARWMTRRVAG